MKFPYLSAIALASTALVTGCGGTFSVGDVKNARLASDLAVVCKTSEALAAAERAQGSGGLGGALGELERVVILRDVGRNQEAATLLSAYNQRVRASATDAAKAESDISRSVEALRDERFKRTGKRTCS